GAFVLSPLATDFKGGDAPSVESFFVNFDEIAVRGKAFAKTTHAHVPRPGLAKRILEIGTETRSSEATSPIFAIGATLIAVAAHKFFLFCGDVAEARDVDAVGTIAEGHFVFVAGHDT